MNMSLFKFLNEVWYVNLHRGIVGSLSLVLMIKIIFILNSILQGERMHKPSLELLICCASLVGELFESFLWIVSPTLILVPVYSIKRNKKAKTSKGSTGMDTGEPKSLLIIIIIVVLFILLYIFFFLFMHLLIGIFFICSIIFLSFNITQARLKQTLQKNNSSLD